MKRNSAAAFSSFPQAIYASLHASTEKPSSHIRLIAELSCSVSAGGTWFITLSSSSGGMLCSIADTAGRD